jgi:hypothetical protein
MAGQMRFFALDVPAMHVSGAAKEALQPGQVRSATKRNVS